MSRWVKFLGGREFTHAVTLKPNHRAEKAMAQFVRSAFVRFHRGMDQFPIGPRYHKALNQHLRTEAVGIVGDLPHVGHIHAVFRVPADRSTGSRAYFDR